MRHHTRLLRPAANRDGIALPLALFGLILVSLIVTSVILSSTTEFALSSAHQDATTAFYTADGALEAYVASANTSLAPVSNATFTMPDGKQMRIDVSRLASRPTPVAGVNQNFFSVRSEPVGGGRAVTSMISVGPLDLGIKSAITFPQNGQIGGSSIVSDGRDSQSCAEPAPNAVIHASGTTVDTVGNNVSIIGGVKESSMTGDQLIRATLGGFSPREFVEFIESQSLSAEKYAKFGSNTIWGGMSPNGSYPTGNSPKPRSWNSQGPRARTHAFNWYCPGQMDGASPPCWQVVPWQDSVMRDTTYTDPTTLQPVTATPANKIVVIDGGGQNVGISGDHGQGMLIVLNGRLVITGGFIYRGIIVSEGDLDVSGTGNKIEGAMIAGDSMRITRQAANDTTSTVMGDAVVRYNACAIRSVINTLNPPGGFLRVSRTFAWSERVR